MSFDHSGVLSIGKPPRPQKKLAAAAQTEPASEAIDEIQLQAEPPAEIIIPSSASTTIVYVPYQSPVEETAPVVEPEEAIDESAGEFFDEAEEGGEELPSSADSPDAAPEAADLIVAPDGASITTATTTRAQRKEKKRGKKAKKSTKFIPEGLE